MIPVQPLRCLPDRHTWSDWELRPPTIAPFVRVRYLYWARRCSRCSYTERRWFAVPAIPLRRRKDVDVRTWLALLKFTPPGPETLTPGPAPEDLLA